MDETRRREYIIYSSYSTSTGVRHRLRSSITRFDVNVVLSSSTQFWVSFAPATSIGQTSFAQVRIHFVWFFGTRIELWVAVLGARRPFDVQLSSLRFLSVGRLARSNSSWSRHVKAKHFTLESWPHRFKNVCDRCCLLQSIPRTPSKCLHISSRSINCLSLTIRVRT